jgi:multiple sugar transport system permease protein
MDNDPKVSRWHMTRGERRNLIVGLLFVSPWIFGFLAFLAYPFVYTVRISLTRYSGFGPQEWIGLENYRRLFQDDLFWIALYNTFFYTGFAVPIGVVVAMVMALAMNAPLPEVPIYRAILYLPSVIPLFALSSIYATMMSPTQGIVNRALIAIGLPNVNWFGDPSYSKLAIIALAQFGAGQVAIIFLAGLKGIPSSLYEAAMLDGASVWRKFWNITVPMMTPVILYDIILGLSLGVQVFTQIIIIFGNDPPGNPANSTLSNVLYLYNNGFRYGQMGYAASLGMVLFVISMLLALVIFRTSKRWVHYEGA